MRGRAAASACFPPPTMGAVDRCGCSSSAPERSEEMAIAPSLEDAARRAAVLPGNLELSRLARRVIERERRYRRPVETVRIETWRIDYAPGTLAATTRLLRDFEYRVDAAAAPRP